MSRRTVSRRTASRLAALTAAALTMVATVLPASSALADGAADTLAPAADVTPPAVTVDLGSPRNGWYHSAEEITVRATDAESGLFAIYIYIPGSAIEYRSDVARPPALPDGKYALRFWARDNAGNFAADRTELVGVDSTPPGIVWTDPLPAVIHQGDAVPLHYSCWDDTSGIESCVAPVADGGLLDTSTVGDHRVPLTAVDAAGNTASAERAYTVLPDPRPTVTAHVPAPRTGGWYTDDSVAVALAAHAGEPTSTAVLRWRTTGAQQSASDPDAREAATTVTVSTEGVTTVSVQAVDDRGRTSDWQDVPIRIDRTAPTIAWDPAIERPIRVGELVPFEVTCADALSGVATCETSLAGDPLPTADEGVFTVLVTAADAAGNVDIVPFRYEVVAADPAPGPGGQEPSEGGAADPGTAPSGKLATRELALTGGDPSWWLLPAGILVVLGGALLLARGRRAA